MDRKFLREGWMDSITFDHHIGPGNDPKGGTVYGSPALCELDNPCIVKSRESGEGPEAYGCVAKRVYVVDADAFDFQLFALELSVTDLRQSLEAVVKKLEGRG